MGLRAPPQGQVGGVTLGAQDCFDSSANQRVSKTVMANNLDESADAPETRPEEH